MVKPNVGPRFRPKRRLTTHLQSKLLCVISITTLYCLIAGVGKGLDQHYKEQTPTGRHLLWHVDDVTEEGARNCTPPAITDFPPDFFTPVQRQMGGVIFHVFICCYLFTLLAHICDEYFVPCIQRMCESLNMSEDIAGATFMAAAVSSPELFINIVGTFITEGDIGVGTVVGSAVFNVLAVPACCGLFAFRVVKLSWWSLSRDCAIYSIAVIALMVTVWDGRIEWYEALVLVLLYIFYILAMYFNVQIGGWAKGCFRGRNHQGYKQIIGSAMNLEETKKLNGSLVPQYHANGRIQENGHAKVNGETIKIQNKPEHAENGIANGHAKPNGELVHVEDGIEHEIEMCSWPSKNGGWSKFWWLLVRPIAFLLYITIPNCRTAFWRKFYLLTFIMCILWIGFTSYLVAWMITIVGDTLEIPDSVMGLTFLAAGMSVPEAVSSVIVTNQGHGSMGISNSIGSNTFDILLCLGLPWFFKSAFFPATSGEHYVQINSGGMGYSVVSLFSTLFLLYLTFMLNDYKLDRRVGVVFLVIYAIFLVMAALIELNIFFPVNLPVCGKSY